MSTHQVIQSGFLKWHVYDIHRNQNESGSEKTNVLCTIKLVIKILEWKLFKVAIIVH